MNSKTKIGSMFLLAAVLVVGTVAMTIPSSFAEPEYREYKDPYAKEYKSYGDPHEKKYSKDPRDDGTPVWDKDRKGASVQSIKCVNSNVNINGIDIKKGPTPAAVDEAAAEDAQLIKGDNGQGNGLFGGLNIDKNLVNICVNFNFNEQEDDDPIVCLIREGC